MKLLQGVPIFCAVTSLVFSQVDRSCTGKANADHPAVLPPEEIKDNQYVEFNTEGSYTLYGKRTSNLFVNKNGVVSFGSNFSTPNTMEFPIPDTPPLIAGFWDNLSLQNENKHSLAFLELNSTSSYFARQQTRLSAYLYEGFDVNMMEFDITHIFLATWKEVIQNSSGAVITFQIALVSTEDSNETYAVLVYEMNGLSTSSEEGIKVGFNAGDGIGSFTHPLDTENRTQDLDTSTNACTCGFYVYRIDKVITEPGINCGGVCDPDNGDVLISSSTVGGVATYTCDAGYMLEGENTRECLCTRQWSGIKPTCEEIKPLALTFINDTPRVLKYTIMASFSANRRGVEMTCYLTRLNEKHNCSSGSFSRDLTNNELWEHGVSVYTLHIEAVDPNTDESVTLSSSFRVFGHQEMYFCSANMVNIGTQPLHNGGYMYVEFISVGKGARFKCYIDGEDYAPESDHCGENIRNITTDYSPRMIYGLNITNLTSGIHRLIVEPTDGCYYRFCYKRTRFTFTVED